MMIVKASLVLGDKNVFTNYRPISLLPQFSKTIERMFNSRIVFVLIKSKFFIYGFRSKLKILLMQRAILNAPLAY